MSEEAKCGHLINERSSCQLPVVFDSESNSLNFSLSVNQFAANNRYVASPFLISIFRFSQSSSGFSVLPPPATWPIMARHVLGIICRYIAPSRSVGQRWFGIWLRARFNAGTEGRVNDDSHYYKLSGLQCHNGSTNEMELEAPRLSFSASRRPG